MALSIGIVGLPNVGKSTLFNALTDNDALAANYPFATIEPNTGIVPIPDPRLSQLAEIYKSQKIVPATVTFVDIAGLVAGASKGEGLGNQFLANIRNCSAICHTVRAFEDSDVTRSGSTDPKRDIEIINTELILADLQTVDKSLLRIEKEARANPKIKPVYDNLSRAKELLDSGTPLFSAEDIDLELLSDLQLLTVKPLIYVFNVDEQTMSNEKIKKELTEIVNTEKISGLDGVQDAGEQQTEVYGQYSEGAAETVTKQSAKSASGADGTAIRQAGAPVIFVCAKIESELRGLDESDRKELLASYGQEESGLNQLIQAAYKTLGLQSYLTAGEQEVRAWTIPSGATAPQAAGAIHTDFERGFIAAQIVNYQDLVAAGSEAGARAAGKIRTEGKTYIMQPDDVVEFRFNV